MRTITANIFLLFTLLFAGVGVAQAQEAKNILEKMDQVMFAPKDISGTNTIVLIDKNGKESQRKATLKQKGKDKRIMRFTEPASQAGIAVLSLPKDVMYLYLPAFGKERRISSSIKNQNFAGTDFSYDDMESASYVAKYDAKIIRKEAASVILELKPKKRSDYSKIIASVHREYFYPEKMEYFDRKGNKVKEATYSFEKIGKYWNSKQIEMKDLKKKHSTKIQLVDVKFDTGIPDDEFTVRKLKQG